MKENFVPYEIALLAKQECLNSANIVKEAFVYWLNNIYERTK